MAAKFELDLSEALRQLAEFNLRTSNLAKHLDTLNGDVKKTGSAAADLMRVTSAAFGDLQKQLVATGIAAKKDSEAIDSAFKRIQATAVQSFSKIAEAQVKSTVASAAYRGELDSVRKLLVETANNNAYVKGMQKQATLQTELTASNKLMRAQIQALATEEGKLNARLKERLGSVTKMAAAEQAQLEKNRQLTQQLELQGNIVGQANVVTQARIKAMQREQAEETAQVARLTELRRSYDSLANGIQQQIAVQKTLNDGQTQAATFTERLNNQLTEQQRRYDSLHGGTAEQIAQIKVLNTAREQEITLLARENAALDAARAKQASLNGGTAEQIARINEQNRARTAQIKSEEQYGAALVGVSANEARLQAQDEARVQSISTKNALMQAAARSTNLLSEADARNVAAAEKLNAQTRTANEALVEQARATMGTSKAQQELIAVQEREQATLARLQAQHALLTTEYGRELAAIKAKIVAQEQLNRLSTMSVGQLLGLTSAHKKHSDSMVLGSQTAASLRAALGGLQANFGMYTSGTIVAASATYALFSQMRSTVALGAEFTASMATANAVMNANNTSGMADGAKALETQVRALGQTTIFTASEVAEGLIDLGQAGLSTAESILALRPALDLAQIGNLSMAESADIATNVMMIFGKQATDLTNIVDIMATAAVDSNTDIKQLANALTYAGPAAEAAGISLEQTTAAIEVLSNSGIKSSRAGTALRKLFTSLLNPTKKGAEVLAQYNIATQNLDGSTRNLTDIVRDLNKELEASSVSEAQRLSSIQNLVGLYATSPVAALIKNSKQLDDALYTLEHNVTGAAERMRNKMADTLKVDWKNTMSAYEELQLQVYDKFEAYLRLTSAKITNTLIDLTRPVKVVLNADKSTQSIDDLVNKANANGNNYTVKNNQAYSSSGEIVDAKQLVAAMKEVDQSQLTVINNLDIMIERFKTFGETAITLVAGLVGNKALGGVSTAFGNLSSDITSKLLPRMAELQTRVNGNAVGFAMLGTRAISSSAAMSIFNTTMALTNRAAGIALTGVTLLARGLNFLAVGASFISGFLGIAAAVASVGYAIYNAFTKDNEQAIIDHAQAVKTQREEYDQLNKTMDAVGLSMEKQALREEAANLAGNTAKIKARLVVLNETKQMYKDLGEEVPKPVAIEISVNEARLAQTEKELNDFNKRINSIGSNAVDVTNAADRARALADAVVAQQKVVDDARFEADIAVDDSRVKKEVMYNAELAKLTQVQQALRDQRDAIQEVGNSAITVANQIDAAMAQARAAADQASVKELSPGKQYDVSLTQIKTLSEEINRLKESSQVTGVVDPQLTTKLKAMAAAMLVNAKALASLNESEADSSKQAAAAALAGLDSAHKKVILQQQVTDLTKEQAQLQENIASGTNQGTSRERLIEVTNQLTTAKNGLATATKSEATAARSAQSAHDKYENKLGDFIGKQEAAATASLASADAYRSGSSALAEYQIQQQLSNEILSLENQKITVNAEERKKLEAAIRSANAAKQEEDVQKSLYDMRQETKNVTDQTAATYKGEEALRTFNVEKQIQTLLSGKSADVVLRDAAAVREQAEAQSLANKALESASRGIELRDQYAPARKYAEDYKKAVEDVNAAHAAGALTDEEFAKTLKGVGDAYNDNIASTTIWGKLTQDALNRVDEAFVDMWKNIGGGFDSFSKSLLDSFKQLLAELAHQAITKPIMISFTNAILGTSKSGGISDALSSLTGGSSDGLGGLLNKVSSTVSIAGSSFGKSVMAGWSSGDGVLGGLQGAFTNGADYFKSAVTSAFSTGTAAAAATASQLAANLSAQGISSLAVQAGSTVGINTGLSLVGAGGGLTSSAGAATAFGAEAVSSGVASSGAAAAFGSATSTTAASSLSALSSVLSYIGAVYSVFQSYQAYGVKGAATTAGFTTAGAVIGSVVGPIGTAAGAAIGAVVGSFVSSKLFSSGEKYSDQSTSAQGTYSGGQYTTGGIVKGWQTKAPKYGTAVDAQMDSTVNKFTSTLGMLYQVLGDGSAVYAYDMMQVRKTSGKYSTTFGATIDGGGVNDLNINQQFSAADAAEALKHNYDDVMGTFLAKAIVSSASLPAYFKAQFTEFAGSWDTTADEVIAAIEGVFTRFNGVNAALERINVNSLKMGENGLMASDNILDIVASMSDLDVSTASAKDKVAALNTMVNDYYTSFFSQEEQFNDLKKSLTGAFAGFGLNLPDTKAAYRTLVEGLDVTTAAGQAMFATFMGLAKSAGSYYDTLEQQAQDAADTAKAAAEEIAAAAEKAASEAQAAADKAAEALASAYQVYYKAFFSSAEQLSDLKNSLTGAFSDMGMTLPTTKAAFRAIVEGLDRTTDAGEAMYVKLMNLAGDSADYYTQTEQVEKDLATAAEEAAAAIKELNEQLYQTARTAASTAFSALQRAVEAQKTALETEYNTQKDALDTKVTAMDSAISAMSSAASSLESALKTLRGTSDETVKVMYNQARETVKSALNRVKGGGTLEGFEGLDDALDALTNNSKDTYKTLQDYLFDQGVNAGMVEQLEDANGKQQTAAEKTLESLQSQLDLADKNYKLQVEALDEITAHAQQQLDALDGIDNSVISVTDAVTAMNKAVVDALVASVAGGTANNNTPANNEMFVKTLYQSLLGREADPTGLKSWVALLNSGTQTASQVAAGIGSSEEAVRKQVTDLYTSVLGRTPDAAGLTNWTSLITSGTMTATQVAAAISGTEEAAKKKVTDLYQSILGRAPDTAGLDAWTKKLMSGEMTAAQVAAGISGSIEASKRHANGASFTNGVVSKPTMFDASLMGEAGSEAILPLTNVGGSLGVSARLEGGGSNVELVREIRELGRRLDMISAETKATALSNGKLVKMIDRVSDGGNSLNVKESV